MSTARAALLVVYLVIGAVFGALGQWIFVVPMVLGFFFLIPAVRRDLAAEEAADQADLDQFRAERARANADDMVWHLGGGRQVVAVPLAGAVTTEAEANSEAERAGPAPATQVVRLTGPAERPPTTEMQDRLEAQLARTRSRPSALQVIVKHDDAEEQAGPGPASAGADADADSPTVDDGAADAPTVDYGTADDGVRVDLGTVLEAAAADHGLLVDVGTADDTLVAADHLVAADTLAVDYGTVDTAAA
jgi:hypothetical protein